jgi:hypothetical protein
MHKSCYAPLPGIRVSEGQIGSCHGPGGNLEKKSPKIFCLPIPKGPLS